MRFTKTIASASVAAVLGLGGISVAGAASSSGSGSGSGSSRSTTAATTASPSASPAKAGKKTGAASARRRARRHAGALAAKTIGITRADLVQELRAGKTIAAIATEHGVQPQAVIDALEAAATARIDAALAAGKITAERATKLKARATTAIPKIVNEWHPRPRAAG